MVPIMIRAGGQTGVDRAALDWAIKRGWPYGGWCPRGGWAEDYPNPPGLITAYPRLTETPSMVPEQRTAWNVRDSHATAILIRGDELSRSSGTVFTRQCAELVFVRPFIVLDISLPESDVLAREWLFRTIAGQSSDEFWLNFAGPRESQAEGVYVMASEFLEKLFPS
jgi:hypothetical protein